MPPKKAANSKTPKKRVAAKGFKLPDPISAGQILTDLTKKQWKIGTSIGQGGFGEIYLASDQINKPVSDDANFVVKIEPHSNGPLFTEMHCYMRIAKPDQIEAWRKERKLKSFGMPKYLGSGSLEYNGQKYRFMVMERFGMDLQKIIEQHKKQFSYKTVVQVAMQIIDVLEYIHHHEYIHADIKASNLLVGHKPETHHQVYLVDYGLACRYMVDGKHKEYKYDARKAHDGTIEFTSRDAHIGAHSRRGDMEILGYNLVSWLCGKLPWENNLQDCDYVANQKRGYMSDIPKLMKKCFQETIPPGIQKYMEYIASMTFDEKPNYEKCKNILREGLKAKGYKEDKLVFLSATPKAQSKVPTSRLKVSEVGEPAEKYRRLENGHASPHRKPKASVNKKSPKVTPTTKVTRKVTPNSKSKLSPKSVSSPRINALVKPARLSPLKKKSPRSCRLTPLTMKSPRSRTSPNDQSTELIEVSDSDDDLYIPSVKTKKPTKSVNKKRGTVLHNDAIELSDSEEASVKPRKKIPKTANKKPKAAKTTTKKGKKCYAPTSDIPTPAMLEIMNKRK